MSSSNSESNEPELVKKIKDGLSKDVPSNDQAELIRDMEVLGSYFESRM